MALINDGKLAKALEVLADAQQPYGKDPNCLATAPKDYKYGPGQSALHFLAFSAGKKGVDPRLVSRLADVLCEECRPLLNHRNKKDMMALHVAVSAGSVIVVKALLEAGAGFTFTFILTLTLTFYSA